MNNKIFQLGELSSNCYIFYEKKEAVIFDIGGENIEKMVEFLKDEEINPKKIIITHGHLDHVEGLNKFLEIYPDVEIYIGVEDFDCFYDSVLNLSAYIGSNYFELRLKNTSDKLKKVREGDIVSGFKVIDTPGHTIGSKCFYNENEKIMITGDTLFKDSVGRTDLPTGSMNQLKKSIEKILKYDGETIVYPGHGMITKIKDEQNVINYFEDIYVRQE